MSKEDRSKFDENFCDRIIDGRKCKTNDYMRLLITFGDIFCGSKLHQRSNITDTIKNGMKINEIISLNMEALMRTIIDTGCRNDWPGYLDSAEYKSWFNQQHGTEDSTSESKHKSNVSFNVCQRNHHKRIFDTHLVNILTTSFVCLCQIKVKKPVC